MLNCTSRELLLSTPAGDLEQRPIGSPTHALRFKRQAPPTLVFVETTQEQVHLIMRLSLWMGYTSLARSALASKWMVSGSIRPVSNVL